MTDRELLELIASQVSNLTTQVDGLTTQVNGLTKDMNEVKATMATKQELAEIKNNLAEVKAETHSIKSIVLKIENDHGQKLGALFDGYKLNSEKLDRIEAEVTKHEEFILKRLR